MLIKVTVIPESSQNEVVETGPDTLAVYVRAAARNGHANREASFLIAKHYNRGVRLVSGGTRTQKIFEVLE